MPRKILITGPISGNFDAFIKRLQSVQAKAGPFEAAFSVGTSVAHAAPDAIDKFVSDSKELSFPVYVFDDEGFGLSGLSSKLEANPACPIQPLTSHGLRTIAGLQVAYLNTSNPDVANQLIADINGADGDIDILVTSEWPENVTDLATAPGGTPPDGSVVVMKVAQAARPRYHISTAPSTFYQREPYMNPDRGAGSHATRFISLGAVANSAKAKWVHALALEPAAMMSSADIRAVPDQITKSPYLASAGQKRKAEQTWRFQVSEAQAKRGRGAAEQDPAKTVRVKNVPFSASEEDVSAYFTRAGMVDFVEWPIIDKKRSSSLFVQFKDAAAVEEACKLSGQLMMGREITVLPKSQEGQEGEVKLNLGKAVKDCWFCLSNDQADVHLVVDVLDEAYIALDKGPINDTHALVLSVEHYPNTVTLQEKALEDMHALISGLRKAYASKGLQLVGFERYLAFHSRGGNHCHLNFIGISEKAALSAREMVENAANVHQFSFSYVASGDPSAVRQEVKQIVESGQYFQFFLPDGSRLVHPIDRREKHPMSFGRECLARLADVPGRADWRQCKAASGAEEEEKTNVFRKFWQSFSPNPS